MMKCSYNIREVKAMLFPAHAGRRRPAFSYEGGHGATFVWWFLFLMFCCCGFCRTVVRSGPPRQRGEVLGERRGLAATKQPLHIYSQWFQNKDFPCGEATRGIK